MTAVKKGTIAIFYGWPSTVQATYTVQGAIGVFKKYDLLVLGSGLEEPSHADHANTVQIIAGIPNTKVYGYIASTIGIDLIKEKIDKWSTMGVAGIFCDVFGFDFEVSRTKQNDIVDYIHDKGLSAFVNTWNPDDAFKPTESGLITHLDHRDWILAESYQIINDNYQSTEEWLTRSKKLVSYRKTTGTKLAAITTTVSGTFDQDKFDYAYFSSLLFNFDAFGWGEVSFSSISGELPFRKRKHVYGNQIISDVNIEDGFVSVKTNVGISINTVLRKATTEVE